MDIEEQYDKIYHYCYFKIYDKQLAQDITQETFQDEAIYDPCEEWVDNLTLRTIIQKMPLEEQELIFLRYVNEISITSICSIMGISRFAIYRKLSKSLKWLKQELRKEGFNR